jgi:CRP/FNR family nitrogen fixation transcriptional regulator
VRIVVHGRLSSRSRNYRRQSIISKSTIGLFDQAGVPKLYSRNQNIYGEGESAEYLYKIQYGCIRTYITLNDGRRQIGSFYFPGDVIGLEANQEHSVSAEAVTR